MAVRCAGAGSGADLSPRCLANLFHAMRRLCWLCSMNCDGAASLRAKTSRSIARIWATRRADFAICGGAGQGPRRCHRSRRGRNIRAVQQATKTIPIVAIADDMVGAGLVNSLARPDGNTTGVSILATELDGKRQEILIEAVPGLRRMAVLADANCTTAAKLDALQEAARARDIELSIHRIAKGEEIAAAIDTAKASGAAALNVLASPLLFAIASLLWSASQHCAFRPSINGPKWRRKAALLPTARASVRLFES